MTIENRNRFEYIDAMRGLAIFLVMVVHAGSRAGVDGYLRLFTEAGQYGVQLFFVVSAYTILLSLDRRRTGDPRLMQNFFIRRLFRIIPVYGAVWSFTLWYMDCSREVCCRDPSFGTIFLIFY